jgi:hypothetical protein
MGKAHNQHIHISILGLSDSAFKYAYFAHEINVYRAVIFEWIRRTWISSYTRVAGWSCFAKPYGRVVAVAYARAQTSALQKGPGILVWKG